MVELLRVSFYVYGVEVLFFLAVCGYLGVSNRP